MFTLTLVTPERRLVSGAEIEEVFVPGHRGELNILPGHAPLMTSLQTGIVKYRLKGETKLNAVAVSWGYAQVNPHGVNILAETAERPEDINIVRVDTALKAAEAWLANVNATPGELEKAHKKIVRAGVRKEVAAMTGSAGTTH